MPTLTLRNIAILGLVQVGVVVAGVLAAGATVKWYQAAQFTTPHPGAAYVAENGHYGLVIPVLWVTIALAVQSRDREGDAPEALTFLSGLLVLSWLLLVVFKTSVAPWLRLVSGCGLSLAS